MTVLSEFKISAWIDIVCWTLAGIVLWVKTPYTWLNEHIITVVVTLLIINVISNRAQYIQRLTRVEHNSHND